ncbi:MAG: LamG-like jellyroll fold domain-containing protein [Thermodesulfobacteriota bacterium]
MNRIENDGNRTAGSAPEKKAGGFTLIELSIVLVIIGIVISVMASVLPSLLQSSKIKQARAILEKFDYTLEGYIAANGRCPCPDVNADGLEDRNDNGTPNDASDDTCSAYAGTLPYLTLGLSAGDDAWRNPVRYGVYEDFIRTSLSNLCLSLTTFSTAPYSGAKVHTKSGGVTTNVAYVLASGGPKDLDGSDSYFDGNNAGSLSSLEFEIPDKIVTAGYDDLVSAASFTYLKGKLCSGGGGSGGGSDQRENQFTDGCTNGKDDDGDGFTDCLDQDCFGVPPCGTGGADVVIATGSVPSGVVANDYSVTFQATGGTTPYEWALTSGGGLTGLYLHPYTAKLSGPLNACPGSYTIGVRVTDSTSGTPKTNEKSFSLQITSSLSVSGPVNVTWSSPSQTENYTVSSSHLGGITCATVPTDYFETYAADESTCVMKKKSTTQAGTYLVAMKATDQSCAANTATLNNITVTVTGAGAGPTYSADLAAEWHLDECTAWSGASYDVVDSIDINNDQAHYGKTFGDVKGVHSGKMCRAAYFDGSGDYISVANSPTLQQTSSLTLALWLKTTGSHSDWVRLAGKGNSTYRNYGLWLATNGTILFQIYSDGGYGNAQTTVTVNDGLWHHVAAVYDRTAGKMTVYIDNQQRAQINYNQNPRTSTDPFTIGYAGFHTYFKGWLDEVTLLHTALTAAQVDEMFKNVRPSCSGTCYTGPVAEYKMEDQTWSGTTRDVTDNGTGNNPGLAAQRGTGVLPAPSAEDQGKICRAGVFTRVDTNNGGYIDIGDPADGDLDPNTANWTVAAWIKWSGASGDNIIYNKENLYEARVNGGYVQYAWQPYWFWVGDTSFPVTANTWYHVTTVFDGARQMLFKDGGQVYSREQTGVIGTNGNKLLIGARGSGTPVYFFGGLIDEFKIYNRALAENEILNLAAATNPCE